MPIDLIVRITLITVDKDLGIVIRIVVPPLSRYVCHRLDARRDSDRELVRQQVTAEVLDLRHQQSLASDASDRLPTTCGAGIVRAIFRLLVESGAFRSPNELPPQFCGSPPSCQQVAEPSVGLPACLHSPPTVCRSLVVGHSGPQRY